MSACTYFELHVDFTEDQHPPPKGWHKSCTGLTTTAKTFAEASALMAQAEERWPDAVGYRIAHVLWDKRLIPPLPRRPSSSVEERAAEVLRDF